MSMMLVSHLSTLNNQSTKVNANSKQNETKVTLIFMHARAGLLARSIDWNEAEIDIEKFRRQ